MNDASADMAGSALALLARQQSHLLFILGDPRGAQGESGYRAWFSSVFRTELQQHSDVIQVRLFERHEIDITGGRSPPPDFRFLGICQLSIDGAENAEGLIERIRQLHDDEGSGAALATWLYFPISERVGIPETADGSMLIAAFANGKPGATDFWEWYVTRHIRDVLKVSVLKSGQCFGRSQFQRAGACEPEFEVIALYEQLGSPEAFFVEVAALPPGTLSFPSLDLTRFGQALYRPL